MGTQTFVFTYDAYPRIFRVTPDNSRKAGSSTALSAVLLHGVNFGENSPCPRARVGRTACKSSPWLSQTSVRCSVASGVDFETLGRGTWLDDARAQPRYVRSGVLAITVLLDVGLVNTMSWAFSYDEPQLSHRGVLAV